MAAEFEPAFRLLDGFLDAWGAWRESHPSRVGALRAYLGALAAAEAHQNVVPPTGDAPGHSAAPHLEGAPRGVCNALPHERYRLAVEAALYGAQDALEAANHLEARLEAEFVVLRTRVARRAPGEDDLAYFTRLADRGPINGELSPCDADLAAHNLLLAVGQELEAQSLLFRECYALMDGNLSGLRPVRRLEARLAVVDQQPFVEALDPAELATRVAVSEAVWEKRQRGDAFPPPPPPPV